MRLWHKNLIPYLPRKQLVGQWRELCSIAKGLSEGTLNHILVNRVKNYPAEHLYAYGILVYQEMLRRGMDVTWRTFERYFDRESLGSLPTNPEIYDGWHNERYMKQCLYNLEEKYDCGGISNEEWSFLLYVLDGGYEF